MTSKFIKKMSQNLTREAQRAQRVQYNVMQELYSIEHEAKLRQKLDLQTSIEGLQKEMRKQIAQALKRSESKVKYLNQKAHQKYSQHIRQALKKDQIDEYNKLVKAVEAARCCGFTIRNYELVTQLFKLPPYIQTNNQNSLQNLS